MASFGIEELRALPDYAQTTRWDIRFLTFPAIGVFGFPISDSLNLRCESIELPKVTMTNFEVQTRGHKTFNNGTADYGNTLTITFQETVDNTIFNLIKAWRELMWSSRQGRSFSNSDTEATLNITMLDNQDVARAKYTVYGCRYSDSDMGTLDGAEAQNLKPSLTLNFDYFVDAPLSV